MLQTELYVTSGTMEDSCNNYHWTTTAEHVNRQVELCISSSHHSTNNMELIQISIVNDKFTRTKHGREEINAESPSPKRLRSAVFRCSTPCSSSSHLKDHASMSLCEGTCPRSDGPLDKDNEWDDSLLDPTDDEGDSPLYLTVDEIESLLEDDSCYAAEASGLDSEVENEKTVTQLPSEDHGIKNDELSSTLKDSTLIGVEESDTEMCNYATVVPLPLISSAQSVEVPWVSNSSCSTLTTSPACNSALHREDCESGVHDRLLMESDLCLDYVTQCNGTRTLSTMVQKTSTPPRVVEVFEEESELPFDCDIDELLQISPGETTSEEDSCTPLVLTVSSDEMKLAKLDSAPTGLPLHSFQSPLPPITANSEIPDLLTLPPEPNRSICNLENTGQDVKSGKSEAEQQTPVEIKQENNISGNPLSIIVDKCAVQKSSKQQQALAPVESELPALPVVPAKPKEKKLGTVAPLPNPTVRPKINLYQLEENKEKYFHSVMMHLNAPNTSQDPNYELASLLNQISRENPSYPHISDFTRRNHPRSVKRRNTNYNLREWVLQNGGSSQRFQSLPCTFQRSPIPKALPSNH
ncbi:S100P-binding protein [Pelobates fuscus]|uniref:S100P-binding protein n=1 Tax=Pelobates fuscus TaxID=191477 RepID=UPI002FE480C3